MQGPGWRPATLVLILVLPALAGCIGDDGPGSDQRLDASADDAGHAVWARDLPDPVTSLEKLGEAPELDTAKTFWIDGDLAYVTQESAGFSVLNLTTPTAPSVVGRAPDAPGRDVDLLTYEDGSKVAVIADSSRGIRLVDVTDPQEPEQIATVLGGRDTPGEEGANVHNVAVVPGTHLIYNSRSVDAPGVDIVDASDPAEPERVDVLQTGVPCHDITFHPPDALAYCAGVYQTQIWDISEPEDPIVVSRITNPSITIHHWAQVTDDGTLLMIGDEFLGATGPYAQGCLAGTDHPAGAGTLTPPLGAVWFYDVSDPADPQLEGYVAADQLPAPDGLPAPCTAHFGDVVGDRPVLALSFIRGGIYLIDISDPTSPALIDHHPFEGETWEVRYANGWLFSTNTDRGMDVFGFE